MTAHSIDSARAVEQDDIAAIKALDHEKFAPMLERSRKVKEAWRAEAAEGAAGRASPDE